MAVARFFGSERLPGSGGLASHSKSDSIHPTLFIEAKKRKTMADFTRYRDRQAELLKALGSKARKADLKPLIIRLCYVPDFNGGDVLVFDYQYLEQVAAAVVVGTDERGGPKLTYVTDGITLEEGNLTRKKTRTKSVLVSLYGKTALLARQELKVPICAVKQPNRVGWLIAVAPKHVPKLAQARQDAVERAALMAQIAEEDESGNEVQL